MKQIAGFPGIYPDVHQERIAAHFGAGWNTEGLAKLEAELATLKTFYVVCFTNRCGSNFLAQALASDGRIKQAGENLNFDSVINQSTRHGFKGFPEYMAWLVNRLKGKENVFGCKASSGQMLLLYNTGVLERLKGRLQFIHITRRHPVDQAISMYIASKTKRWTSIDTGIEAELAYEPNELLRTMEALSRQNATFAVLFDLFGIKAVPVQYEKLIEDPVKVVRRVGRNLGLANLRYVADKIVYERQADDLNAEFRARIHADFGIETIRGASTVEDDDT